MSNTIISKYKHILAFTGLMILYPLILRVTITLRDSYISDFNANFQGLTNIYLSTILLSVIAAIFVLAAMWSIHNIVINNHAFRWVLIACLILTLTVLPIIGISSVLADTMFTRIAFELLRMPIYIASLVILLFFATGCSIYNLIGKKAN